MNQAIENLKELARGMKQTAKDYGGSRISREFNIAADRIGFELNRIEKNMDDMWAEIGAQGHELNTIKDGRIYKILKALHIL
jgi:hypothetical protein